MGVGVGWGRGFVITRKGVPLGWRGWGAQSQKLCDLVQTLKDSWIPKRPNNS